MILFTAIIQEALQDINDWKLTIAKRCFNKKDFERFPFPEYPWLDINCGTAKFYLKRLGELELQTRRADLSADPSSNLAIA